MYHTDTVRWGYVSVRHYDSAREIAIQGPGNRTWHLISWSVRLGSCGYYARCTFLKISEETDVKTNSIQELCLASFGFLLNITMTSLNLDHHKLEPISIILRYAVTWEKNSCVKQEGWVGWHVTERRSQPGTVQPQGDWLLHYHVMSDEQEEKSPSATLCAPRQPRLPANNSHS